MGVMIHDAGYFSQSPITNYGFPQIMAVNAGEMTENLIIKDLTPKLALIYKF